MSIGWIAKSTCCCSSWTRRARRPTSVNCDLLRPHSFLPARARPPPQETSLVGICSSSAHPFDQLDDVNKEHLMTNNGTTKKRSPYLLLLLLIPFIATLYPGFYNATSPDLGGIPFFYWYQ